MDISKNSELRAEVQGAGTGMYDVLHEASEQRATLKFARKMDFQ